MFMLWTPLVTIVFPTIVQHFVVKNAFISRHQMAQLVFRVPPISYVANKFYIKTGDRGLETGEKREKKIYTQKIITHSDRKKKMY